MALKKKITAAEHAALHADLQAQYTADGDAFVLQVEGDDSAALRSAIEKERKATREAAAELARLRDEFKDLDPESAREALKQKAEIEEKQLLKAGDVDQIVAKRTEALRRDYDNKLAAAKKTEDDLRRELGATTESLSEKVIDGAILEAFTKAGGKATAHVDVVGRARQLFKMKDGKPVPMNGEDIVYGKDAGTPMSPDEWVASLVPTAGHLFEGSTGSGAENKRTNGGANQFTLTRDQARDPKQYQAMKEKAQKAGQEVAILAQ